MFLVEIPMKIRLLSLLALGLSIVLSSNAGAQFDELVRRVPSSANAVVLIDAEKVFDSPAAVQAGWKANRQKAWDSGLSLLPPTASQAILAAQLDLNTTVPSWEVAVMRLEHEPSLSKLADLGGGTADKIGDYNAVQMAGGSYVVDFTKRIVGAIAPGSRQQTGRWVRETEGRAKFSLSPYLTEAYHYANDLGTPVIMALDLEDAVNVDEVRAGLDALPAELGVKGINLDQLAASLSSIRGVTLGITLRAQPHGKIKVDFAKEMPLPANVAKGLLLHALAKRGAMIDEFEEWTAASTDKQLTLEGNLTQSGIRRLSSLFHRPPAIPHPELEVKSPSEQSPGDVESTKVSTQRYFSEMTKLLEDLSDKRSASGTKTMGQVGVFCERYAAKIEKLPTLNVDPELLDFSSQTCNSLRLIHSTIHAGAAKGSAAARSVTPTYNYYGYGQTYGYIWGAPVGSYGYAAVPDMRQYYNDQSRVKYEANSKATFDVRQVGQQIRASVADMRRKMTEKYRVQF